jgi:dTDP-4-amino-4,6-dideoxygalactose transaminase
MEHFKEFGIGCGVHYPIPLHLQPALKHLGYKEGDFPVSEKSAQRILSFPMFAELKEQDIRVVCEEFFKVAKK